MRTLDEIKTEFINYLTKIHNHKEIPNSSLIPINDPSVLFTTAGMHPIVIYLLGEKHPLGKKLVNVQRSFRTDDIESVGDTIHHTFFEMLGYWSLGDYFKSESLDITWGFFTKIMNFDPNRLYATVYEDDENVPVDQESIKKWKSLYKSVGIEAEVWDKINFEKNTRIFPLNRKENWWGPAGQTGPCGPDSELFYWRGKGKPDFSKYVPWDDSNMFIEISNNVFMQYNKDAKGDYNSLSQKNIDFGAGLERIALICQFMESDGSVDISKSVYDIDSINKTRILLESFVNIPLANSDKETSHHMRIILDHIRSAVFLIADGTLPSNKDRGYILRRLIRRIMRSAKKLKINDEYMTSLANGVIDSFKSYYPHLEENRKIIIKELENEKRKFNQTLEKGLKELEKLINKKSIISGNDLFSLYETYGFPVELSIEILEIKDKSIIEDFNKAKNKHQEQSRILSAGKFKGGLADSSEETIKLHTLQHVLLKVLQNILDPNIHQKGSNINSDRLRLDFNFNKKLTDEEVLLIEEKVNDILKQNLTVQRFDIEKSIAENIGAEKEFGQVYPDIVSVYVVGLKEGIDILSAKNTDYFSAEFCGGPHVKNTSEIISGGKKFKIFSQESSGSGIRRIKAGLININ